MTGRFILLFSLGALFLIGLTDALARPEKAGTEEAAIRSQLDREWIRVYEDGQHGAVFRFQADACTCCGRQASGFNLSVLANPS